MWSMGEAQIRTSFDLAATYQVTAPGNGSAYASLWSLLTGGQQSELANYLPVQVALFSASAPLNYQHATPGNGTLTVDAQANPQTVVTNQKPNELISVMDALNRVYVRSTTAGTVTAAITVFCVARDTL